MRIENPTPLETLALPMINRGDRTTLIIIVKGTFTFAPEKTELADDQIPIAFGDQLYEKKGAGIRYETDLVPFKPKTDVVLCGRAYAPQNQPAQKVDVSLKLGPVEKHLRVYGKRLWNYSGLLSHRYAVTATKPFVTCPIRYTEAFGGMDPTTGEYCDRNLAGKGYYSRKTKNKLTGWPLPRIEDPKALIRTPEDHPKPVGFGFYHRAWQPRAACAGTFDDAWRKNRSPKLPEDFNYHFYNGAHPDLQVKGYLNGDEPVELVNLTPEGLARFDLPGIMPACLIKRINAQESEKVKLNLDTVFIEPDKRNFSLVWRGAAKLAALSEAEIEQVSITVNEGR
jgi:hypothetical protein